MMDAAKEFKGLVDLNIRDLVRDEDLKTLEEEITLQTTTAARLCASTLKLDMVAQFVDPEQVAREIAGTRLNVPELIAEATKICPDIIEPIAWNKGYYSLDVMRRILYMIGPETRSVKVGRDNDKRWNLRVPTNLSPDTLKTLAKTDFMAISGQPMNRATKHLNNQRIIKEVLTHVRARPNKANDGYIVNGMFTISTYKNSTAPVAQPQVVDGVLLLTIKQASIIALYILSNFTKLALTKEYTILTPLAGAIFPRASLEKMMEDPVIASKFQDKWELLDCINKSAQNGGQFLDGSRTDVAAVCVLVGTSSLEKEDERKKICHRTIKQFLNHDRPAEKDMFKAMVVYATQGVPSDWTFEVLINDFKTVKTTIESDRRAIRNATVPLN
ncbi:putative glycoprotein 1 [Coredo virus]|uniref:Putative glycoprotein 1 n=1 Tax=Coredo virus TaxID=2689366 RepID=A0A6B9KGX6_9VIRU|nr:putative glycoprotein 1 [Coredo virus]QHA33848.1 putative glycoprotein 1 [Coredo virus]